MCYTGKCLKAACTVPDILLNEFKLSSLRSELLLSVMCDLTNYIEVVAFLYMEQAEQPPKSFEKEFSLVIRLFLIQNYWYFLKTG